MANSKAKIDANNRYDAKTYAKYVFRLRYDDDADIIADIKVAQEHGITYRDWLRQLYEDAKR